MSWERNFVPKEFRVDSERFPVTPWKKVLIQRHSEFRGSSEGNGTEFRGKKYFYKTAKIFNKMICLYLKSRLF